MPQSIIDYCNENGIKKDDPEEVRISDKKSFRKKTPIIKEEHHYSGANLIRSISYLFRDKKNFFLAYEPRRIAEFLTIIENETIKSIDDRDLVLAAESEVIRNSNAQSLWTCVELFNKRTRWIQSALLDNNINTLTRTKMISSLIAIAESCRILGNFATLYQIVSSLKQPCIWYNLIII